MCGAESKRQRNHSSNKRADGKSVAKNRAVHLWKLWKNASKLGKHSLFTKKAK
ncbi:MAG: hypothetical protein ACJAXQ_001692 [Parvibaculaceae bacterium]|jgi:hypothetical protein